jgi:hypothetical protein
LELDEPFKIGLYNLSMTLMNGKIKLF